MTVLERIVASTRKRVAEAKACAPLDKLMEAACQAAPRPSFKAALQAPGLSFICEIKKASPSKGVIAEGFDYAQTARDYEAAGANAISVLTEPEFFMGRERYLAEISGFAGIPLLRKDFIIDERQVYESKVLGASAILLICAILTDGELRRFRELAESLGLDALAEAHDEREVKRALSIGASIIGVNNRDLKTFGVDFGNAAKLRALVPQDAVFVAESGIAGADDIRALSAARPDAVLIGEALMRASDKAAKLAEFRNAANYPPRP